MNRGEAAVAVGILAVLLSGCSLTGGSGGGSNSICAATQGKAEVSGVAHFATYLCRAEGVTVVLVEVRNETDSVVKLGGESSEAFTLTADGTELDSGELRVMPQYLAPGETGYLGGWATEIGTLDILRIDSVDIAVVAVSVESAPAQTLTTDGVAVGTDGGFLAATGSVTNTGSETIYGGVVAVVLFDGSGVPLGWLLDEQTAMELEPGATASFSASFPPQSESIASLVKSTRMFAFDLELF